MDIEVIFSKADPIQRSTRDFVVKFCQERGILARIYEYEDIVQSIMLVVDGVMLKEKRLRPRPDDTTPYPTHEVIARTLEQHAWG
jgi:hypothetical protein